MLMKTIGEESKKNNMYCVELFYFSPDIFIDVYATSERKAWEKIIESGFKPMEIVKYG